MGKFGGLSAFAIMVVLFLGTAAPLCAFNRQVECLDILARAGILAKPDSSDLYERMGLTPHASAAEVSARFRRIIHLLHPDVLPDDLKPFSPFGVISDANDTLSDPEKRADYDRTHFANAVPESAAPARRPHYKRPPRAAQVDETDPSLLQWSATIMRLKFIDPADLGTLANSCLNDIVEIRPALSNVVAQIRRQYRHTLADRRVFERNPHNNLKIATASVWVLWAFLNTDRPEKFFSDPRFSSDLENAFRAIVAALQSDGAEAALMVLHHQLVNFELASPFDRAVGL